MRHLYQLLLLFLCFLTVSFADGGKVAKRSYKLPQDLSYGDYLPNVLIIKYKNVAGVASADSGNKLKKQGVEILDYEPVIRQSAALKNYTLDTQRKIVNKGINRIYKVSYRSKKNIEGVINTLLEDDNIEYAEPSFVHHTFTEPDDPFYSNQYYLNLVKATEAWEIQPHANQEVIAIIDSGSEITHPDLAANIFLNENDPIDGIDNDMDGYVDNYYGWDFVGATLTGGADNNPNVITSEGYHGIHVSGIASAVTNNGVGVASLAGNARLMILKAGADDTPRSISHGYQAILYAVDRGVKIINCSWGSTNKSSFGQDVIDYALSKGCLVIAAAGNDGNETPFYPAAYKGVLAVANTGNNDVKSGSSNYGYHVALSAPGVGIYNTMFNASYGTTSGTSMAAPLVASAAALLAAKYPNLTGLQIGELLKQNTDDIYQISQNQAYLNKLGTGRLNVAKALLGDALPAIKKTDMRLSDASGSLAAGTTINLSFTLENILRDATNLVVELKTEHPQVTIVNGVRNLGYFSAASSQSIEDIEVSLHSDIQDNQEVVFYLTYRSDAENYSAKEYFVLQVNRDYLNYEIKEIATTITSNGRFGFADFGATQGNGFIFKDQQLLFEAALMVGSSGTELSDNARNGDDANEDFVKKSRAIKKVDSELFEAVSVFTDSGNPQALGLEITNRHVVNNQTAEGNFIIAEYEIKNNSSRDYENMYVGLFTDWDIDESDKNITRYNPENKLAYAYSSNDNKPYAGVRLLSDAKVHYYPLSYMLQSDLLGDDSFTKEEKYTTLSSGIFREELGAAYNGGLDIMYVTALGPFKISKGQSVKAAFAFVAGEDLDQLKSTSQIAQEKYNEYSKKRSPEYFVLLQNYPNPVERNKGAKTTVEVKVPSEGLVSLNLCNLFGQRMTPIFDGQLFTGSYTFDLDLKQFPPGVYYINATYKGKHQAVKVLLTD